MEVAEIRQKISENQEEARELREVSLTQIVWKRTLRSLKTE